MSAYAGPSKDSPRILISNYDFYRFKSSIFYEIFTRKHDYKLIKEKITDVIYRISKYYNNYIP